MNAEDKALLESKFALMNMENEGWGPGVEPSDVGGPVHVLCAQPAPSVEELEAALSLGSNYSSMSSDQCIRAILIQNSVMLREFIFRKQYAGEISSRSASLPTTAPSSADSSNVGSPTFRPPPANFECPLCLHKYNEKDFDRHVHKWIGRESVPLKSGSCSGIRDPNHPLLQEFAGNHAEKVQSLVTDIRSILRPGAYDSMSPTGSGRNVVVAARFAALCAFH